jgi:glycosyltransferase involved in cell wall biosynthesis
MKISGFTYVRNGIKLGYPFIESIKSLLEIVDEYVVVLGDSDDGSKEAIQDLKSSKIKIIDTVWDMSLRADGKIFAQQSDIGLDNVSGDWVIHLQADEVLHEDEIRALKNNILKYDSDDRVEGLLFPFLNFRGDYEHIHAGRKAHRYEIRAFRKNPLIRAYKDSQGFRKYTSLQAHKDGEKGQKLRVAKINVSIFHYNYVRPPKVMKEKAKVFLSFYNDDKWIDEKFKGMEEVDYNEVDQLKIFKGTHPKIMKDVIKQKDWNFTYDPAKNNASVRHRILNKIEEWTGYRIGEYKNYKIV